MPRVLQLMLLDFRMKLKRALAFRTNFVVGSLVAFLYSFVFALFQFFVYTGIQGYPGWSSEQMLLFQATLVFWTGLIDLMFGGVRQFIDMEVLYGNFDRFFIWPPHTLVSLLTRGTNVYALSTVLAGGIGVVSLALRLDLRPNLSSVLAFCLFLIAGTTFYVALLIVYCGCTLFMVKMERLREVLDRIVFFGSFPADVYVGPGKVALLTLFPIALWVHLPTQALLGRLDAGAFGAVGFAVLIFALAVTFWQRQERRYVSAGG